MNEADIFQSLLANAVPTHIKQVCQVFAAWVARHNAQELLADDDPRGSYCRVLFDRYLQRQHKQLCAQLATDSLFDVTYANWRDSAGYVKAAGEAPVAVPSIPVVVVAPVAVPSANTATVPPVPTAAQSSWIAAPLAKQTSSNAPPLAPPIGGLLASLPPPLRMSSGSYSAPVPVKNKTPPASNHDNTIEDARKKRARNGAREDDYIGDQCADEDDSVDDGDDDSNIDSFVANDDSEISFDDESDDADAGSIDGCEEGGAAKQKLPVKRQRTQPERFRAQPVSKAEALEKGENIMLAKETQSLVLQYLEHECTIDEVKKTLLAPFLLAGHFGAIQDRAHMDHIALWATDKNYKILKLHTARDRVCVFCKTKKRCTFRLIDVRIGTSRSEGVGADCKKKFEMLQDAYSLCDSLVQYRAANNLQSTNAEPVGDLQALSAAKESVATQSVYDNICADVDFAYDINSRYEKLCTTLDAILTKECKNQYREKKIPQ